MQFFWGVLTGLLALAIIVRLVSRRRGGPVRVWSHDDRAVRERLEARSIRSPEDPAFREELRQLVRQGQKIEALKMYRLICGGDLRSAKEAIEAIERETVG